MYIYIYIYIYIFYFIFLYFPVAGNKRKKKEFFFWCRTELGYCPMKLYGDRLKEERLGAGRTTRARAGALGA